MICIPNKSDADQQHGRCQQRDAAPYALAKPAATQFPQNDLGPKIGFGRRQQLAESLPALRESGSFRVARGTVGRLCHNIAIG
jgi:hypothetical protein